MVTLTRREFVTMKHLSPALLNKIHHGRDFDTVILNPFVSLCDATIIFIIRFYDVAKNIF